MVLEEQPAKVSEALTLFIQGLGFSLSVFRRKHDISKSSGRQSSLSDVPLGDEYVDYEPIRGHIVENPIAEKC